MKHIRMLVTIITLAGLGWANDAAAQIDMYDDAWSEDTYVDEEDPPSWYWSYGSSENNGICPVSGGANCQAIEVSVRMRGRDTGNNIIAEHHQYGSTYASTTIQPVVSYYSADGDYPNQAFHDVRYLRFEGGVYEEYNWWEFLVANIKFKGINNRYVWNKSSSNPWVFVSDDCTATCQSGSEFLTSDPGVGSGVIYLHRKVRRVGIFGFGKCFNARLSAHNFRGNCTT